MKTYTEVIELSDRTIRITHKTGLMHMFWTFTFKPFAGPFREFISNFKPSAISGVIFGIVAWAQGLFETSVVLDLFAVPQGLVEGLFILVSLDFIFGTARAIFDSRVKFHAKKWIKSFFKIVSYTGGIIVLTVGANMFPIPFEYVLKGCIMLLAGYEMWSCSKHLKLTAVFAAAWELYKNKGDLREIDFGDLFRKIDERSAREFTEKQMYYFGDEDVEIEETKKTSHV